MCVERHREKVVSWKEGRIPYLRISKQKVV
jgi:hypothetical protein